MALFTLAVCAGCWGFIAIGDWIESYRANLVALFQPEKGRLLSTAQFGEFSWSLTQQAMEPV